MSDQPEAKPADQQAEATAPNDCFVIMPISDTEGYGAGHFTRVYEDIIKPACEMAELNPVRADDNQQTDMIHFDIVKKIVQYPMAICDLSSRNPNVLFELGIRQAFNKPVVLIQEKGVKPIFDVGLLRTYFYRRERIYHEVLEDQREISKVLIKTKCGTSTNSILSLLAMDQPATVPNIEEATKNNPALQLIVSELGNLRNSMAEMFSLVLARQSLESQREQRPIKLRTKLGEVPAFLLHKYFAEGGDGLHVDFIDEPARRYLLEKGYVILEQKHGDSFLMLTPKGQDGLDQIRRSQEWQSGMNS
jgi:hypothetical protein